MTVHHAQFATSHTAVMHSPTDRNNMEDFRNNVVEVTQGQLIIIISWGHFRSCWVKLIGVSWPGLASADPLRESLNVNSNQLISNLAFALPIPTSTSPDSVIPNYTCNCFPLHLTSVKQGKESNQERFSIFNYLPDSLTFSKLSFLLKENNLPPILQETQPSIAITSLYPILSYDLPNTFIDQITLIYPFGPILSFLSYLE